MADLGTGVALAFHRSPSGPNQGQGGAAFISGNDRIPPDSGPPWPRRACKRYRTAKEGLTPPVVSAGKLRSLTPGKTGLRRPNLERAAGLNFSVGPSRIRACGGGIDD